MFHYQSCGLENVFLRNGYVERDTPYGMTFSIHDIEGLHKAIGLHIVCCKPGLLSDREVVFLRTELDLPQRQLAQLIGVGESTVRNWESGRGPIQGPADRILRTLYKDAVCGNGKVKALLDQISQLNREGYSAVSLEMEEVDGGWLASAA